MDQVSLYRKYRPHNFDNLIGQDHIKTTLINAIKNGHVSHAYLFTGPRGTGKTSTARLIAKALNCNEAVDGFEPCDKCEFCTQINDGSLIDLIEIDAASNRGIDEVRDLKEKINFAPNRSKYKIFIIDEVHMMTKEAFNALLKTLEEPPAHAFFILATTEIHKIPETIISRCQRFDFKRIDMKALMTRLSFIAQKEGVEAETEALELISRYVDGGMRDAIGLMEQLTVDSKISLEHVQEILGISSYSLLEDLYLSLAEKNIEGSLKIIQEVFGQGSDLRQFSHDFIELLRQKMIVSINSGEREKMSELLLMIEHFQKAQERLSVSTIPQLPLEIAVIECCGGKVEVTLEQKESVKAVEPRIVEPKKIEAIEKKTETLEEKTEVETEVNEGLDEAPCDVSLKTLQEKWPRITERIKSPSLRMSLKSGLPSFADNSRMILQFSTNFHKDKVIEHDNRVELETVIKEVLGKSMKIETIVKELEIKAVEEKKEEVFVKEDRPATTPTKNSSIDQALEIFGGEIV